MFNEAKCVRPMFGGSKLKKKNVPSDFFFPEGVFPDAVQGVRRPFFRGCCEEFVKVNHEKV